MREDEFRHAYAKIEEGIAASEELKRRTKASLGMEGTTTAPAGETERGAADGGTHRVRTSADTHRRAPYAGAWRAIAAVCAAALIGIGAMLAFGALDATGPAPESNAFSLAAYADESGNAAHAPVALTLDEFFPTRSSAGYLHDGQTDSVDYGVVTVSRYYAFDMSVIGTNVASVAYAIEGEGATYGSWSSDEGHRGEAVEESSTSFTIAYDDGEPVIREIGLAYVLDAEEKSAFDEAYHSGDIDGMEALLAACDAKRLAGVTVTVTATFFDGTVQTKAYTFTPVEETEDAERNADARALFALAEA